MTDYAGILTRLHGICRTWDGVAAHLKRCRCIHPRSYWHGIAVGKILNPGLKERNAIVRAAKHHNLPVSLITKPKFQRKSITLSTILYNRLKAQKTQNSQTWNQLIESMLNKLEDGNG